jgi:hypothetical protein
VRQRFNSLWLILGLLLACAAPVAAAPAFVQGALCTSTTTCTLGVAPGVGDTIVAIIDNAAAIGSVTLKDSASNALTEHTPAGNCASVTALCGAIFDETVSGVITGTFTLAGMTAFGGSCLATYSTQCAFVAEFSGITTAGALYAANNAASMPSGGTILATIAGVTNGSMQVGLGNAVSYTGSNTSPYLTPSNPGSGNAISVGTFGSEYVAATSTTSSTMTSTSFLGTSTNAIVMYADYPALGGGGSSTGGKIAPWIGAWVEQFIPLPNGA